MGTGGITSCGSSSDSSHRGEGRLAFDILNARMIVNAGPDEVAPEAVVAASARTGMRAEPGRDDEVGEAGLGFRATWGRTILTATGAAATGVGAAVHVAGGWTAKPGVAAEACYVLAMLAGLRLVLPKAWIALKRLRPDMNLLMVVAVCGAVAVAGWAEAATVAFLFALSLELGAWSEHPLARAVIEYVGKKGVAVTPADDLRAMPGKGTVGRWRGREFWPGHPGTRPSGARRRTTCAGGWGHDGGGPVGDRGRQRAARLRADRPGRRRPTGGEGRDPRTPRPGRGWAGSSC
jgi:cation transport ATPase